MTRYVNEKEASKITGFAVQTLRNYRFLGRGPAYSKVSERAIRYSIDDLTAWMEAHKVNPEGIQTEQVHGEHCQA